jgi:hypothetical protein
MLKRCRTVCVLLYQGDPQTMRMLHGWLTVAWFVAAIPICVYLYDSVPFLVFISVYAVVTGHWSSWQAARVEEKQDVAADTILDASAIERSGNPAEMSPSAAAGYMKGK